MRKIDPWPASQLETVDSCPVCGSPHRAMLYDRLTDRINCVSAGTWTLFRCRKCHSAYLDPRPTSESIGAAYGTGYYTHKPTLDAERKGIFRRLKRGYLNAQYGYALNEASVLGALALPLLPRQRLALNVFIRHMKWPRGAVTPRLLDVGCGNGAYLRRMHDLGWSVQGLEPDPSAAHAARALGVEVSDGSLVAGRFPSGHFDAITLSHVIEHLHDPISTLRVCWDILKPGGTLWVATPNLDSSGHCRFGRYWNNLDPPRHLVLFTPGSLREAILIAGFVECRFRVGSPVFASTVRYSDHVMKHDQLVPPRRTSSPSRGDILFANLVSQFSPHAGEELVCVARRPMS